MIQGFISLNTREHHIIKCLALGIIFLKSYLVIENQPKREPIAKTYSYVEL